MSLKSSLLLLATAIVLVAMPAVKAQPQQTTVSVGGVSAKLGDQMVVLPAPAGFEEATRQWEVVKARFAASEPPEDDLLAGYLRVSDCDLLRKGQQALYPSWAKIAVFRAIRERDLSTEEYAGIVAYFRQSNAAKAMDPNSSKVKQGMAQVDQALSKEYSKDIKLDLSQPKILGEYDSRQNVYSNLLLMNIKAQADGKEVEQQPVLVSMTVLYVKKRVLLIASYLKYKSEADVETLKQFTTKWMTEILAAN